MSETYTYIHTHTRSNIQCILRQNTSINIPLTYSILLNFLLRFVFKFYVLFFFKNFVQCIQVNRSYHLFKLLLTNLVKMLSEFYYQWHRLGPSIPQYSDIRNLRGCWYNWSHVNKGNSNTHPYLQSESKTFVVHLQHFTNNKSFHIKIGILMISFYHITMYFNLDCIR